MNKILAWLVAGLVASVVLAEESVKVIGMPTISKKQDIVSAAAGAATWTYFPTGIANKNWGQLKSIFVTLPSSESNTCTVSMVNGTVTNLLTTVTSASFVTTLWSAEGSFILLQPGDKVIVSNTASGNQAKVIVNYEME